MSSQELYIPCRLMVVLCLQLNWILLVLKLYKLQQAVWSPGVAIFLTHKGVFNHVPFSSGVFCPHLGACLLCCLIVLVFSSSIWLMLSHKIYTYRVCSTSEYCKAFLVRKCTPVYLYLLAVFSVGKRIFHIIFCLDWTPATVSLRPVCMHATAFLIVFVSWNAEIQCG